MGFIVTDAFGINCMARRIAAKRVKAHLLSQGLRIMQWPKYAELKRMGDKYIAGHRAEISVEAAKEWEAIRDKVVPKPRRRNRFARSAPVSRAS